MERLAQQNDFILVLICAATMALGTMIGGKKIIISVGEKLTKIDNGKAAISEISTVITLLLGNTYALPLSTSHVKTIATASVGGIQNLNLRKMKEMLVTWALVLPACSIISFALMKIILKSS